MPTPPVLIVQAVHDYLIDVEDIDRLADAYSAGGADVTYHRDAFNEHLLLHPLSAPMALRWLQDRFARRPLTDHLVRTTWPTMFNPTTYVGMVRLAMIAAKVITGRADAPPSVMTLPLAVDTFGRRNYRLDGRVAAEVVARVAAASTAYTSAAVAAGSSSVQATCSGDGPKKTGAASMK